MNTFRAYLVYGLHSALRALGNFEFSVLKMQTRSAEIKSMFVWGGPFLGNFISWLLKLTFIL